MTQFTTVYNRFLGKITDDMYLELTPEDTVRDLQNLYQMLFQGLNSQDVIFMITILRLFKFKKI